MGIIKEPLDVDFVVENRPLTKEEVKQISEYILSQKKKEKITTIFNPKVSKARQKV